MPQRLIVLDDTDPSIQYSGQWFIDKGSTDGASFLGPTYNHTLHGTASNGSVSLSFEGNFIRAWGTNGRADTSSGWDPHWECFVDNISIGASDLGSGISNNHVLCEKLDLNDGLHEFTINITSTTGQGNFLLDYIHYAPSATVSKETAYILVESTDSGISYGPEWRPLGSTANMTSVNGSEFRYDFTGKGLSWFGFVPTELPHNGSSATYSIDGGPPVSFILAGLSEPQGTGPSLYNQVFFTTPELPLGPHNLHVVNGGTAHQTPLTLDYLIVTNSSSPASPVATPTPSGSGPTLAYDGPPLAAIIGIVVGSITIVMLGAVFVFFCRRKRKTSVEVSPFMTRYDLPTIVTPFRDESQTSYISTPVSSVSRATRKQEALGILPGVRPVSRVHQDSGMRFPHESGVVDLPPGYSAH